ncbi:protein TsetseEP-like [Cheilinus undulatus]|uniref:protein TsetseEP-like n=1 Tax=Cheilinus undulatus TaxID=241271 RepID=UPI001BD327D0|nr:protein TsetseEP-like [Cheilinus undulatus]
MGNRLSRRRDAPASSAEAAATEQKTAEEPAAVPAAEPAPVPAAEPAAEDSGITQEAVQDEEVIVGEPVTPVACLPSEDCVAVCKGAEAPPAPEPEPVAKEAPAPVQPEPPVQVSEPEPVAAPEPVSAPEPVPEPVAEAQLAPEPAPEPVTEPEPIPEPEPTSQPEPEVEPVPESLPPPVEAPEPQIDLLTQESLPEPELPSPPLIDLGVPDEAPEPVDTPLIPEPVSAVESADVIPVVEGGLDGTEDPVVSALEPEKSEETSEFLEKHIEVEVTEDLEKLMGDVNMENVNGLLKNLELKGNDLLTDLIPNDVTIADDTLITNMSTPAELM